MSTAVDDSSDALAASVVPPALPATQPAAAASNGFNMNELPAIKLLRAAHAAARHERLAAAAATMSVLPRHILIQGADGVCIPMLTHIAVCFESWEPRSLYCVNVDANIPGVSNSSRVHDIHTVSFESHSSALP